MGNLVRLFFIGFLSTTFILPFSGCKKNVGPRAPVKGKIMVGDEPLTKGFVVYSILPADPNIDAFVGAIQTDGTFELAPGSGVPVGRYKVTVFIDKLGMVRDDAPFAPKYSLRKESDLVVEVTENAQPRAYDLNLEKNSARGSSPRGDRPKE